MEYLYEMNGQHNCFLKYNKTLVIYIYIYIMVWIGSLNIYIYIFINTYIQNIQTTQEMERL